MDTAYKEIYENLFPYLELVKKSEDEDGMLGITYSDDMGEYYFLIDQYIPGYYSISLTIQWNNSQAIHPYDFKISVYKPGKEIASELNSYLNEIQSKKSTS